MKNLNQRLKEFTQRNLNNQTTKPTGNTKVEMVARRNNKKNSLTTGLDTKY